MLVAVTVAPATTASCWSVMAPFSVALATSTCADAGTAQSDTTTRTRKAKPLVCIGDVSFSRNSVESWSIFEPAERCHKMHPPSLEWEQHLAAARSPAG